jgi:hypothetical protein
MVRKALTLLIACLILVRGIGAAQQSSQTTRYGVPPAGEQVLDLSGTWRVKTVTFLDDQMTLPDYDDHDWNEVSVPARWSEQGIEPAPGLPTVAVYRRTFRAWDSWTDQPIGVAAWLIPSHSTVTVNGTRLEPHGQAPWLYAEVTDLLNKSSGNVIVVTAQFDGIYEMAFPNPPRVGPLGEWLIPAIQETAVSFDVEGKTVESTLYSMPSDEPRPGVLLLGTGSHGLAFVEPFLPLASELVYAGYAALPIALDSQTPQGIADALAALRDLPGIDGSRIGVVAAVSSAAAALEQASAGNPPAAMVTLSSPDVKTLDSLAVPVLLIASAQDQTGPTAIYAQRIAEKLSGPSDVLILPGSASGLGILDTGWNPVRESILGWFGKYLMP